MIFQSTIEHGTVAGVHVVQGWIDDALALREDEISAAGGLFLFYDLRTLTRYDSDARQLHFARMRARPRNYLRHSVVVVPDRPLLRMAAEAANLVASMVARAKVELAVDASAAVRAHGIPPPGPNDTFPQRT